MGGGDGWWAAPLPPPTGLLPRALMGGGLGGEGGPFSDFAFSSASGFFASSARSVTLGARGVIPSGEMKRDGNAYGVEGGGVGEVMDAEVGSGDDGLKQPPPPPLPQQVPSPVRNGKSIAERRAERCGFFAPRINTARFRCSGSPICSPAAVRSPCLTIPPGLSPTALLDSPVMLMNAQAQPSPTTGTFPSSLHNHGTLGTMPLKVDMEESNSEALESSSLSSKLPSDPVTMSCIQGAESKASSDTSADYPRVNYIHSQTLAQEQMQIEYDGLTGLLGEILPKSYTSESQSDMEASDDTVAKGKNIAMPGCHPQIISDETQLKEPPNRNDVSQHPQDGDHAGTLPSFCVGRPSDDGFNWRKYGQKQVKGSEFPRSYYKCTHPNCQVKKKVERSYDGQITEIIYKGKHNHPKPQPARRTIIGSSFPLNDMSETSDNAGLSTKTEGESVWSTHHGSEEDRSGTDCQPDGLERMSSTSAVTDLSESLSSAIEKHLSELESTDNLDLSSTLACHDEDDQVTQESMSLEGDDEDGKSDSKRRKNENYLIEASSASRAVREPRVVVQTESEVDILDDGYRWRKYGQKVVKGNPNPRSYYKCTSPGCSVRKHVERAAHDLKSVITTYEGKHNHEVPLARNSSHSSSNGGSFPPASSAESAMLLPRSAINPEHTTNGKDLAPHFKRKLDLSKEYTKPSYTGTLCGDTKFGSLSCYETKLLQQLAFQHPRLSINHTRLLQTSSIANCSPEFPISFPMSIQRTANTALADINSNLGGASGAAVHSLIGQQPKLMDLRLLKAPKQEQKDNAFCSSVLPMNNLASASSFLHGQIMGKHPLQ